ncbi:hypothetical protein FHX15_005398 [Rhizobium sp. BK650]|nr:hypothetical protein [Rhizobium sp. BK650]
MNTALKAFLLTLAIGPTAMPSVGHAQVELRGLAGSKCNITIATGTQIRTMITARGAAAISVMP